MFIKSLLGLVLATFKPRKYYTIGPQFLHLFSHPLNRPLLLTEWASIVLLHPKRHAAEVKTVVALAPHDDTILFSVGILFAFTLTS